MASISCLRLSVLRSTSAFRRKVAFLRGNAFLYNKCCVIVIRGGKRGASTKFVYSPYEEELVLDRGTSLCLKSIKTVRATARTWKHPAYAVSEHPPFGGTVQLYEAYLCSTARTP